MLIYQDGTLQGLHWGSMAPGGDGGAIFWLSPCMSLSIVVGLGLDYDIFFLEVQLIKLLINTLPE